MAIMGYYQGILQLRNTTKRLIDFVKKDIKKNRIGIAKTVKLKNGNDFYLSSNKYILGLGKTLKKRFYGELKVSRKLFSQDRLTCKKIWRITVLFRMAGFNIGDVIRARRKQVKVIEIGDKIMGYEVESGRKISFKYEDVK